MTFACRSSCYLFIALGVEQRWWAFIIRVIQQPTLHFLSTLPFYSDPHGLINHKPCVGFPYKSTCRKNFPALFCHPSKRKCLHLQTGDSTGEGGGEGSGARPVRDTEIAAKCLWNVLYCWPHGNGWTHFRSLSSERPTETQPVGLVAMPGNLWFKHSSYVQ
jgi:hypothetical protein